ncbi:MAG TPA: PEP-CTERM sorting domain-containing protein [Verrucomicrobiae bacterium]|nr:PEP-CTERM sorting domain-containing protein [Verrucomicrobiae bacterium]
MKTSVVASIVMCSLALAVRTYAGLDGREVTALMEPSSAFVGFTQFSSPLLVGSGAVFSGSATDTFGQVWDITMNVSDTSFSLGWTELTRGNMGGIASDNPLMGITLAVDEPIISSVSFGSVANSTYGGTGLPESWQEVWLSSLSNDSSTVDLAFHGMWTGDVWQFNVATVPEPNTSALVLVGAVVGWVCARSRKVR